MPKMRRKKIRTTDYRFSSKNLKKELILLYANSRCKISCFFALLRSEGCPGRSPIQNLWREAQNHSILKFYKNFNVEVFDDSRTRKEWGWQTRYLNSEMVAKDFIEEVRRNPERTGFLRGMPLLIVIGRSRAAPNLSMGR